VLTQRSNLSVGPLFEAGESRHPFSIQSLSKPFLFALLCEAIGEETARDKLGVNSTGLPFNSVLAVERSGEGLSNPMVNAGAIAATSLVPGDSAEAKWSFIEEGFSRFAGRPLQIDQGVYAIGNGGQSPQPRHRHAAAGAGADLV
jgi:glutaminase